MMFGISLSFPSVMGFATCISITSGPRRGDSTHTVINRRKYTKLHIVFTGLFIKATHLRINNKIALNGLGPMWGSHKSWTWRQLSTILLLFFSLGTSFAWAGTKIIPADSENRTLHYVTDPNAPVWLVHQSRLTPVVGTCSILWLPLRIAMASLSELLRR